ncbi:type II toxin-antitoxin system MqsR family toxin [Parolsenella catena]|uniref:type II toxin-antitoxin system MqsR family toxin n=1 Tax=Parolsenella catena TaxID=2003188 RepID=UPI002FDDCCD5
MAGTRNRPTYDLDEVRDLVMADHSRMRSRADRFVRAHYGMMAREVVRSVFAAMRREHFVKSVELEKRPGTWADVYVRMVYDDVEWYVKFFIDGDEPTVEIWSLNWDGTVH